MPENEKSTQVKGKPKRQKENGPCPHLCTLMPTNIPDPSTAMKKLHPDKDVFVIKVSKVGIDGIRRCKMELELVTPKGPERKPPARLDTREAQCEPICQCGCCCSARKKRSLI